MQQADSGESAPMLALRKFALAFPETEEGSSCVKRAFKARKKAFFYLGMHDETYNIMVKLVDSIDEAADLESKDPDSYRVGAHGWTTVTYSHDVFPPQGLIEGWIEESYRALVHKDLVAQLTHRHTDVAPSSRQKTASQKKATRKKSAGSAQSKAKRKPAKKKRPS